MRKMGIKASNMHIIMIIGANRVFQELKYGNGNVII